MTVAAAVLAAGAGSRFKADGHKLLARFKGYPLASWALASVARAGFDRVFVVGGAVDLTPALEAVEAFEGLPACEGHRFDLLHNPRWDSGQASSLQVAVAAADEGGHDFLVVGLADQPMVPTSAWRSVGASAGEVVVATFDGERRPPVKLGRSVWDLLPTEGDDGARILFQMRPDIVSELPCSGTPFDIDTTEDLEQWS